MLEEHEWEPVQVELMKRLQEIKDYRATHDASLKDAEEALGGTSVLDR